MVKHIGLDNKPITRDLGFGLTLTVGPETRPKINLERPIPNPGANPTNPEEPKTRAEDRGSNRRLQTHKSRSRTANTEAGPRKFNPRTLNLEIKK
ncbi:hypothetical protein HanXRQr2_Chr04g0158241 [Helianthus annuus]|uniref:Uncharacterized protein n=1 Tax=Helianthus annuus TaxID=4232 RepID=A0A251TCW6_HELAN|nr:hypothetical protein HanXRQr2_Chr04g0158241 [Helianthus annuus]